MGYDITRFEGEVDKEMICPICSYVLEDPQQTLQCEHVFCSVCIHVWLIGQQTCPLDKTAITSTQLQPVPRILRNLLSRLTISCDNEPCGCTAKVKLGSLHFHLRDCEYNPIKAVKCEKGCGLLIPKYKVKDHNCVKELCSTIRKVQQRFTDLHPENMGQKIQLYEQKLELKMLKGLVKSMREPNPRIREMQSNVENEFVIRWVGNLRPARVTDWFEMTTTPDAIIQANIKRALIESGSPSHIVNELIENAHERRWPIGLSTYTIRQFNSWQYEKYVTKRIPGKQAVVIMACENQHMPDDLIIEPGLVMIFCKGLRSRGLKEL